jgi:hypothetical protein
MTLCRITALSAEGNCLLKVLLSGANPAYVQYGSDLPFTPPAACRKFAAAITSTPLLDAGLRQRILLGNAQVLLELSPCEH